jgi:tetratricopeptide (TPR) repeat protein
MAPHRALLTLTPILALGLPVSTLHAGEKTAEVAELIKKGDAVYAKRFSDKVTWEAIGHYREALKLDPKSFDALWRLGRAFFWLTDNTEEKAKKRDQGDTGYKYAVEAAKLKPNRVEGHFFAALCIGEFSKGIGILTALRQGIEKKFREPLDQALRIQRGYDAGGPDRAYGVFFHSLPWPKRDNDKAVEHLNLALKVDPNVARTHFYLAQVLEATGKKDEARQHLDTCLKIKPGHWSMPDNLRYQWHCKQLMKKL